eukprot:CAMPEP_0114619082 /NCGR_PEP_ID=MMETSP0168-20121206/8033_1 /TAXON_ID=95228 ORGANISM="Vannella sp., Strain DIVA3 517/6/12" /NCGR_SAMPLE_ID=MMETSP0168 /ASSEMBLY_ACC=CAM_ASM_000044 /LENGTH=197 /DNA_ID=CAMNT_0001830245 /DNA_START=55 /DNA_END=645 /DNA_ORIENTATION=-
MNELRAAAGDALQVVYIMQLLACLELIHSLLCLVPSPFMAAFTQIAGRNHILFACVFCLEEELLRDHAVTLWFLIVFWTVIELVRYPFYASSLFDACPVYLIWMRYTIFIPTYPLGFGTELYIYYIVYGILQVQAAAEAVTGVPPLHTVRMPNCCNFGFDYGTFLIIFSLIAIAAWFQNYLYMFDQRSRKLSAPPGP